MCPFNFTDMRMPIVQERYKSNSLIKIIKTHFQV